jgi:2,4-diaminopentanoate dehydrogenase
MKKIRVIQVATGTVGTHSLRTIIGRDDMELVGLLVFNPDKVGKDAGEIVGTEPTGIFATDRFEDILALDADAVSYNALGETLDPGASLDQICRLLESGKNVCSTAVSVHIYPKFIKSYDLAGRLQKSCEIGNVSFHSSGVNPGFMMDVWPITLCRLSRHIETIYMTEMVDMSRYTSSQITDYIGFGKTLEETTFQYPEEIAREHSFVVPLHMLADATGLDFDDLTLHSEGVVSDKAIITPACKVEPGKVGAVRFSL